MLELMKALLDLCLILLTVQPVGWRLWIVALLSTNLGSVFFFGSATTVSLVIFIVFNVQAFIMAGMFKKYGYVKLLGLAHAGWLVMLPWIYLTQLPEDSDSALYYYLVTVLVIDGISTLLDIRDVTLYFRGMKDPAPFSVGYVGYSTPPEVEE